MSGCANITFVGRLARDPELRYTQAGSPCCTITLAVSEGYTDTSGQKRETAVFFDVVCYNKLAEACGRYLTKGSLIAGTGKLQMSMWQDKTTGKSRKSIYVKSDMIEFISSKQDNSQQGQNHTQNESGHIYSQDDAKTPSSYAAPPTSDVPF